MRYTNSPLVRYGLPAAVLGLGALMFVPVNDAASRSSSVSGDAPRVNSSYISVAPDLVKHLDASLAPAVTTEDVVAREASLPEPAAQSIAPSSPQALIGGPRAPDGAPLAGPQSTETAAVEPLDAAPGAEVDPDKALRVGDSGVNMRVSPSTKTGIIRTLQPGEGLAMGETDRGWVSVRTEDGESGWVYSTYLTGPALAAAGLEQPTRKAEQVRQTEQVPQAAEASESRGTASPGGKRYARVGTDTQLRAGPSQGTERLFVVPAGEQVAVAEVRGGWVRVVHGDQSGWFRIR